MNLLFIEEIIMDYNFDIILSESDLDDIGFNEKKLFWGGEELSLTPREFLVDDVTCFIELSRGKIHDVLIHDTRIKYPIILSINRKYSSVEDLINSNNITKLFDRIGRLKHFELYLWRDDESINTAYEYTDKTNTIAKMREAIKSKRNIKYSC